MFSSYYLSKITSLKLVKLLQWLIGDKMIYTTIYFTFSKFAITQSEALSTGLVYSGIKSLIRLSSMFRKGRSFPKLLPSEARERGTSNFMLWFGGRAQKNVRCLFPMQGRLLYIMLAFFEHFSEAKPWALFKHFSGIFPEKIFFSRN